MSGRRDATQAILHDPRHSRLVLTLAWPVVASMGLQSLFILTDLFWVGRLGAGAVASVSTSVFVSWTLLSLGQMISVGVLSLAARQVGAGRRVAAAEIAWQGFFWGSVLAAILVVAGLVGAGPLFRAVTEDPEVRRQGTAYLKILFASAPVLVLELVFQDLYRGVGDTATPFQVLTGILILNAGLDPLLIFGVGPFPRWEVAGAAAASAAAHLVGLCAYVLLARRGRIALPLGAGRRGFRPRLLAMRRITGIGFPITFTGILFSAVYLFLGRVASGFGTATLAALGIVNRVEALSFLTIQSIGTATAALVGQNLGAGKVERATRLASRATLLGSLTGAAFMGIFLVLPEPLLRLFTSDPAAVREGVDFLRAVAVCQVFQSWELVLSGGFAGAGHTLPPMLVSVPISLIRIPAAWLLSGPAGLGPPGIWWTVSATAAVRGAVLRWWWGRGTWRTRPAGADGGPPPPAVLAAEAASTSGEGGR